MPRTEQERVLREAHDEPTAGHLGIPKPLVHLSHQYYWPGMLRTAAKYVCCCLSCQKYKAQKQATAGKMRDHRLRISVVIFNNFQTLLVRELYHDEIIEKVQGCVHIKIRNCYVPIGKPFTITVSLSATLGAVGADNLLERASLYRT